MNLLKIILLVNSSTNIYIYYFDIEKYDEQNQSRLWNRKDDMNTKMIIKNKKRKPNNKDQTYNQVDHYTIWL